MPGKKRWHPAQESDELVFAVCDRFLRHVEPAAEQTSRKADGVQRVSAGSIVSFLRREFGRKDLTREKIYPLLREAVRRNYLLLQPPRDLHFAQRISQLYGLGTEQPGRRSIQVVNRRGPDAGAHVAAAGADLLLSLIKTIGKQKRDRQAADPRVHLGLGGGYSAMMVAKRLANRVYSDLRCPPLVLHAVSAGGFLVNQPEKAPVTYFSFFDDIMPPTEFVGLFSATVVPTGQYQQVIDSPGVRESFQRASEVDIVVTSFASARDEHGLLNHYLEHLVEKGAMGRTALEAMRSAGWVGDVQFRPYTAQGPILEGCPVQAVTLFDIPQLVSMAAAPGKYVVLLAGPCSDCGATKTEALVPLLTERSLRLWTHLVTDAQTARELILVKEPGAAVGQNPGF